MLECPKPSSSCPTEGRVSIINAVAEVIEQANILEFYSLFARLPGARLHDEPECTWVISGVPHPLFNGVLRTRFGSDAVDTKIDTTLAHFGRRRVPLYWYIGPSTTPADLRERLRARGLIHVEDAPGMAADLQALREDLPVPTGLTIRPVGDLESLKQWVDVFASPGDADVAVYVYGHLGTGPGAPFRHYVGLLDGEPVGCSSLFLAADVVTVQHVATVPHMRRQGVGTAMTLTALREGRALGYRIAAFPSTPQAVGVYRRIGFEEYCRFSVYYWPGVDNSNLR